MAKYNGWANYQTWNVAWWMTRNDEGLYTFAKGCKDYEEFQAGIKEYGGAIAFQTPDGVSWNDSALDIDEIDSMIAELRGDEDDEV